MTKLLFDHNLSHKLVKLIWLCCGNAKVVHIERLLRESFSLIEAFATDETAACLELY
jgi:predicted nuclease of predicted toxin-antitoxin system